MWRAVGCGGLGTERRDAAEGGTVPIKVLAAKHLPGDDIGAVRTPLGIPNDYKPWIARLPNGQLLMVAFCFGGLPSNTDSTISIGRVLRVSALLSLTFSSAK